MTAPLVDPRALDALRVGLDEYAVDAVRALLGPVGSAAQDVRAALHPFDPGAAGAFLEYSAGSVRARAEIRPWGTAEGSGPWWLVSDFGGDVRPGPQPAGPAIDAWFARQRWPAELSDDALLAATLRCADGLVRLRHDLPAADGWRTEFIQLRQTSAMRWELKVDDAVSGLVAACDGTVPLTVPVAVLAAAAGRGIAEVVDALLPVVHDPVSRGFREGLLEPGIPGSVDGVG